MSKIRLSIPFFQSNIIPTIIINLWCIVFHPLSSHLPSFALFFHTFFLPSVFIFSCMGWSFWAIDGSRFFRDREDNRHLIFLLQGEANGEEDMGKQEEDDTLEGWNMWEIVCMSCGYVPEELYIVFL